MLFTPKHTTKRYESSKKRLRLPIKKTHQSITPDVSKTKKQSFFSFSLHGWHLKKIINTTLIGVIIIACTAFILYAPFFSISTIDFSNSTSHAYDTVLEKLIHESLIGFSYGIIPSSHYFVFDPNQITQAFSDHPYITNLNITKKWFTSVEVMYTLRQPAYIFEATNGIYSVDSDGFALAVLENRDQYTHLPLIKINKPIELATQIQNVEYLGIFSQITTTISNEHGIGIVYFDLLPESRELHVITNEGWELLIALDRDIDNQLQTFTSIINNQLPDREQRTKLEYIDVRIEQWVYYK